METIADLRAQRDAYSDEIDSLEAKLAECREKLDQEREWIDTLLEDEMIARAGSYDSRDEEVTQVLYELRMSISRRQGAGVRGRATPERLRRGDTR